MTEREAALARKAALHDGRWEALGETERKFASQCAAAAIEELPVKVTAEDGTESSVDGWGIFDWFLGIDSPECREVEQFCRGVFQRAKS